MNMGGLCVKVECIAIVKDRSSVDERAQQIVVDAFTRLGVEAEAFCVMDEPKQF